MALRVWPMGMFIALTALACALVPGCSWKNLGRLKVNSVRGSVFAAGKPTVGAKIFFHPIDNLTNPRGLRPFGEVAEDGTFELSTYLALDGAPAGDYVVTVHWPAPRPPLFKGKFEVEAQAQDRLKGLYSDPRTSKLRAHIVAGDNDLEPFQLP